MQPMWSGFSGVTVDKIPLHLLIVVDIFISMDVPRPSEQTHDFAVVRTLLNQVILLEYKSQKQ